MKVYVVHGPHGSCSVFAKLDDAKKEVMETFNARPIYNELKSGLENISDLNDTYLDGQLSDSITFYLHGGRDNTTWLKISRRTVIE